VEKAICADPKLAALNHQIANAYASLTKVKGSRAGAAVRRAQRNFIAEHNGGFGQAGHDLQPAMQRVSMRCRPRRTDRVGVAHFLGSRCSFAESAGGKMLS
jgi:hypothetical protein